MGASATITWRCQQDNLVCIVVSAECMLMPNTTQCTRPHNW
jgi:hypothetical protein